MSGGKVERGESETKGIARCRMQDVSDVAIMS